MLEWIDNYCLAKTEQYRTTAGDQFVTRHMECNFISPAYLGDLITMRMLNEKVGNTSVTFEFEIDCGKNTVAHGKTTFVKLHKGEKTNIYNKDSEPDT